MCPGSRGISERAWSPGASDILLQAALRFKFSINSGSAR